MHLNDQELQIWNENKEFFAPGGIPNNEAYQAYLGKYSQLGQYHGRTGFPQQQLLGVLLKHAPDMAFQTAFALYYPQFRTGNQSAEFDTWLGEFAAARPEVLATALKTIAPDLNFTQQVMVLRDVQRWFPGSNIKEYAPPKLLKTKPSVILKQFNPTLVDMPYLLAMSASLMQESDPQSKALGDTIVRGSFIARYGMAPESDEGRYTSGRLRPTVKYCTTEAFAMLQRHGIDMDAGELLQQVQLRYNAQSVMFDALAYPVMVFEDPASSPESRRYAQQVLGEVMVFVEHNPVHAGFMETVETALARIYATIADPAMKQRIEDAMTAHMLDPTLHTSKSRRTYGNVLGTISRCDGQGSDMLEPLARRVFEAVPQDEKLFFLESVTVDADDEARTLAFVLDRCDQDVRNAFFGLLPAHQMEEYIAGSLRTFFANDTHPQSSTDSLKDMFKYFAQFDWSAEQAHTFRQSPLAPTTILVYLYMAATGNAKDGESTHRDGLPFTQWKPLPFLKKMYPEKMALWNQMTVGLLQMPTEEHDAGAKMQYQRVMGSMFQAFSQAFLPDGPSLAITRGIIESLGANPLDYFMDAHKKTGPVMDLALPEDMFAFE